MSGDTGNHLKNFTSKQDSGINDRDQQMFNLGLSSRKSILGDVEVGRTSSPNLVNGIVDNSPDASGPVLDIERLPLFRNSSPSSAIPETSLDDVFKRHNFDKKYSAEYKELQSFLTKVTDVNQDIRGKTRPLNCCLWYVSTSNNLSPFDIMKIFATYGVDMNASTFKGSNCLFDLILEMKLSGWSSEVKKLLLNHIRLYTNANYHLKNVKGQTAFDLASHHHLDLDDLLPLFLPSDVDQQRNFSPRSFGMIPVKRDKERKILESNLRLKSDSVV